MHRGATSQDVVDSAAMLVARRALDALLIDVEAAADAAARLANEHRDTPMAGRTLLQQAVPVTFGLKAAGWLVALDEAAARLAAVRDERLAAQLGGAAGTLGALGDDGLDVLARFAASSAWPSRCCRGTPTAPASPTSRARWRRRAGCSASSRATSTLLAQTEVAEVREGGGEGRGGSSAMPHKRNPVAAVSALAAARQAPGLAATLLGAMEQEHERAAGAWQAEWRPLSELLRATGSAAAWARDALEGLEVDGERMRANVDERGLAERVAGALASAIGREAATAFVRDAVASGRPLAEAVAGHLPADEIARLLDPSGYLGAAGALVDRALAAHQARR